MSAGEKPAAPYTTCCGNMHAIYANIEKNGSYATSFSPSSWLVFFLVLSSLRLLDTLYFCKVHSGRTACRFWNCWPFEKGMNNKTHDHITSWGQSLADRSKSGNDSPWPHRILWEAFCSRLENLHLKFPTLAALRRLSLWLLQSSRQSAPWR